MPYRQSNDVADTVFIVVILISIGSVPAILIFENYGFPGIVLTVAAIFASFKAWEFVDEYKNDYERRTTPCEHGVPGARWGVKTCIKCQQDREARIEALEKQMEESEAQRKTAYREWVSSIRLPEYLAEIHPYDFERLVCDLFKKQGYEVEHTKYIADGGIDAYLKKNGQLTLLQCKRVKGYVGEPVLRDLFGSMHAASADQGMVVTTGKVSGPATLWAKNKPIRIIERDELIQSIRKHFKEDDIVPTSFVLQEPESDKCPKPECGGQMRVRTNRQGTKFWGCDNYPSCTHTTSWRPKKYYSTT